MKPKEVFELGDTVEVLTGMFKGRKAEVLRVLDNGKIRIKYGPRLTSERLPRNLKLITKRRLKDWTR